MNLKCDRHDGHESMKGSKYYVYLIFCVCHSAIVCAVGTDATSYH